MAEEGSAKQAGLKGQPGPVQPDPGPVRGAEGS